MLLCKHFSALCSCSNQLGGLGSSVIFPQWGLVQSPGRIRILCFFELENGNIFYALRKNSSIDKKCRNDVQKLTPTKNFRGNLEFPGGGISSRLYV